MRVFSWQLLIAGFVMFPVLASAADITSVPAVASTDATPWAATVSAGFLAVRGNTNSTSLNFKGALGHHIGNWNNVLQGQANYAKDNSQTSAQSWQVGDQLRYNFNEKDYGFATLNYLRDRFAGIEERMSEAVGYGRRIINTPTQSLDLGIGAGANQQRVAGSNTLENEPIAVFNGAYVWAISSSAQFSQLVHVEAGSNNTYVNPITSIKLTIVGHLFATISYELRYNTTVPAGTYHSDSITTINLGYDFGKF